MSVIDNALKSVAMLISEEAKAYGISLPDPPNSDDTNSVISYLKQVVAEIEKVANSSAKECLETIESALAGNASEDDVKIKCPIAEELPASPLDPFR